MPVPTGHFQFQTDRTSLRKCAQIKIFLLYASAKFYFHDKIPFVPQSIFGILIMSEKTTQERNITMKDLKKISKRFISAFKRNLLPCALAASLLLLSACAPSNNDSAAVDRALAGLESRLDAIEAGSSSFEEQQNEDRRAVESKLDELKALIEGVADVPNETAPEEEKIYFGFSYIIEGEGVVITAYSGDSKDIIIPASILGNPVVAISDDAFKGSLAVSVSIPETVESIGWFAFAYCPRLERIVIPQKVNEIGYGAFEGSALVSVYAAPQSYAAKYAGSYGIKVVNG